jgi:predicted enzyme related to lactoylglutathione lyase
MWQFGDNQGGGIRQPNGPEGPGAVPYVEVPDIKAAHAKAIQAGATEMMPPTSIPGSGGWISIVQAPGGPAIGLWGTK